MFPIWLSRTSAMMISPRIRSAPSAKQSAGQRYGPVVIASGVTNSAVPTKNANRPGIRAPRTAPDWKVAKRATAAAWSAPCDTKRPSSISHRRPPTTRPPRRPRARAPRNPPLGAASPPSRSARGCPGRTRAFQRTREGALGTIGRPTRRRWQLVPPGPGLVRMHEVPDTHQRGGHDQAHGAYYGAIPAGGRCSVHVELSSTALLLRSFMTHPAARAEVRPAPTCRLHLRVRPRPARGLNGQP